MEYKILRNKRVDEDYKIKHHCYFCSNKSTQVLELPFIKRNICKTCLQNMINALDKNMINNFQNDFEESRKS